MYDPLENMDIDLNAIKTHVIINVYGFLEYMRGDVETFRDIIFRIINCDTVEELFDLELGLEQDDDMLEHILAKLHINRETVVDTGTADTPS